MKNILLITLLLVISASPALSLMINDGNAGSLNGTDVGNVDSFLAGINYDVQGWNSNPEKETEWVNSILIADGLTTTFSVKNESVAYFNTDGSGIYAFYLEPPESEYFLLKNAKYWALFKNNDELDWGVFNADFLPDEMNIPSDEFQISHVSRFGGAPVPEPATILLLGAGLTGLATLRARRKQR